MLQYKFCFAGGVLHYILVQSVLWWIFHVLAIFWKVYYPIHSRSFDLTHRTKYIHATCLIVGLVLPAIPLTVISVNGGFIITRFPPIACVGKDADSTFYSALLPIVIIYGVGTNFLVFIVWTIRRVSGCIYMYTCNVQVQSISKK